MALYKPVISWFGTSSYCTRLQQAIQRNIPTQPISYRVGKLDRDVHVQCEFVAYSESDLPQTAEAANVIGRPLVHMFVITEKISSPPSKLCCQQLEAWLRALERRCLTDWMVLIVAEDCAGKPKSKIKNVLADRVKSEYFRQNSDRLVVLYDPFKLEDSLVKESWAKLLQQLGSLIKSSYQRLINAYEIHINHLRHECRERKCNYFEFFSYQEELAAVYESLSVFDEALSQYEQLESLFKELVSTFCSTGRSMPWLVNFVTLEFTRIDPLGIVNFSDPEKRAHVRAQMANLFEFKLYLFSRKCCYYSLLQEYERIPEQAVRFLLGTLHQARLLKLDVPDLLVDAWVLLCCLQVRHIVQRYSDILNSGPMADVCHLANRKLLRLGHLCGLMSERPSSEQIQRMLQLRSITAGSVVGEQLISCDSADQMMADWLSRPDTFRDAFHELIDFAISVYKHQGRARFAALASVEKADFYFACGDPARAERFYKVALKDYKAEAWPSLVADARRKILLCQRAQGRPREQTIKALIHVAASDCVPSGEAAAAWAEVCSAMRGGPGGEGAATAADSPNRIRRPVRLPCEPLLRPTRLTLLDECPNRRQRVLLRLVSAAPQPIDGVTVKCFARNQSPSATPSSASSQAGSPVRQPPPPKPPKPVKPLSLKTLPSLQPQGSTQQLLPSPQPPPLERSYSRLSALSLAPSDLVEMPTPTTAAASTVASPPDAPTPSEGDSVEYADYDVLYQVTQDRCAIRFGASGGARPTLLSMTSVDSSVSSPERRAGPAAAAYYLLASSVRIEPGENRLVLEAQSSPAALLEPGDIIFQCGALLFNAPFSARGHRRRLLDDTWRDANLRRRLLPSLEAPRPEEAPLLMHFEQRIAVRLQPGILDLGCGSDGRPELRLLADGTDSGEEPRLQATRTDAEGSLDFMFAYHAEPCRDEPCPDGYRGISRLAIARLPVATAAAAATGSAGGKLQMLQMSTLQDEGSAARAELRFLRPVLFTHCLHSAGAKSYLSVHLRPNEELNETLIVSNPRLSLETATLLCNVEETLAPGCAVAYLWELPQRYSASGGPPDELLRLSCSAQRIRDDSRAVVTYTFRAAA